MDVLLYNAITENQKLEDQYNTYLRNQKAGFTVNLDTINPSGGLWCGGDSPAGVDATALLQAGWNEVLGTTTAPKAFGLEVCDGTSYKRCQSQCNWTVPTGVTRATFQSWGPGSGSGSNCCCGGSPFGANGAYTVVEIDVTPGEIFCLCSGCAYCCYAYQTTPGSCGSNTCICSNAGLCWTTCSADITGTFCKWNCVMAAGGDTSYVNTGCNNQIPTCDGCGPNQCSGWNFCWSDAVDDVNTPFAFDPYRTWEIPDLTSRNGVSFGIPSMYPEMFIPASGMATATSTSAPVYGFPEMSCTFTWNGSSCFGCNYRACQSNRVGPAGGGSAGSVFGGCNACGGDSGRMGMICVSYNCT